MSLVLQDLLVHRGQWVLLDQRVHKVQQDQLVILVCRVLQVLLDQQALKARPVLRVRQERREQLGLVHKGQLVQSVLLALRGRWGLKAYKVRLVLVLKAHRVVRVFKAPPVQPRAFKVLQELLDLPDLLVLLVRRDLWGYKVQLVLQVLLAPLVRLAPLDPLVHKVQLGLQVL